MIKGLCLRVYPSGARNFALDRMTRGRRHYTTIGNAETMSVPQARREARALITAFTDTVKKGWQSQDAVPPDERIRRRIPRTLLPATGNPPP